MKRLQTLQWYVFKSNIKFLKLQQKIIKVDSVTEYLALLQRPSRTLMKGKGDSRVWWSQEMPLHASVLLTHPGTWVCSTCKIKNSCLLFAMTTVCLWPWSVSNKAKSCFVQDSIITLLEFSARMKSDPLLYITLQGPRSIFTSALHHRLPKPVIKAALNLLPKSAQPTSIRIIQDSPPCPQSWNDLCL